MSIKFLIFLSLLFVPLFPLLHPGIPITHDGQDHVARIANFYLSLSEGNLVPRWAGNLNWGYGHPILMFLYPLPSYFASLFHFLGFSLIDSLKLVFGVSFIASGITMYLWAREQLGEEAGLVAGALYVFAPYRFVDLYVRGAIGEHLAFVFPPLVLYFMLNLSKKYSFWYLFGGSLSFAALILSHNAISLMFVPVILVYSIFLLLQSNKKKFLTLLFALLAALGFGLSSFFWIPAFFEGKYTLRNIVTSNEYASRFVDVKSFIYGAWNYGGTGQFTTQIGIVQLAVVISAILITLYLFKKKDRKWIALLFLLLGFFASIFIMTPYSGFLWEKITTIQKFQFPWRFLSLTVFICAFLGGLMIASFKKRFQLLMIIFISALALFLNKDFWKANGYLQKNDSFFKGIYKGTTDTGESAPIWSVRFMEKSPKARVEVISGRAIVREIGRNSTKHEYVVESYDDTATIRENTLYFPGWKAKVDGKSKKIEFQDPSNRGVITFFVEEGKHSVVLELERTKLRLLADTISLISLFAVAFCAILPRSKLWKRFL